ncbi:MAG: 3-oxoacyl-ACP synthase [Flavobacteriaceae bacterium]|nr:3-oxoacyl-ACP synthase [Flavobacteriaceae bacterium]|tara:strand:+ start:370 stop:828 length:459 start_codon:yes stop_codon:yes gene_type:complete
MTLTELKTQLLEHCQLTVQKRFDKIRQTIADIEESLLEESKSSSGDKHETGRAMLQIDRENAGKQLHEVENVNNLLKRLDVKATADYVRLGSLVRTNLATYFISISIGAVAVGDKSYMCVALNSPIGLLLSGKKKGDQFIFNDKEITILGVK